MRHAEEPAIDGSLDLSDLGRARAERLAPYLAKKFGRPDFIHVAAPTESSARCYLTMRPLADAAGVTIDGRYKSLEFGLLAARLLADPAYTGKSSFVCWTHKDLPALAGALDVRVEDFPLRWDERVFDHVYLLSYKRRGRPQVKRFIQRF